VGTLWELAVGHDDEKTTITMTHHHDQWRTIPHAPGLIHYLKTQDKLVNWHRGSGNKNEGHATPKVLGSR
jgi:hypothetical protein